MLEIIAGADPHDSTAAPEPVPSYTRRVDRRRQGLRIGVPRARDGRGR